MAKKERLTVVCPSCQTQLVIDPKTGLILHKESAPPRYSFDDALRREQEIKQKSDEVFNRAFEEEKKRRSGLEEKFNEALKSKDELDEPPPRPWDLD